MTTMKTHDEMIQEWMQDPDFVRAYEALEDEFALFDELLRARKEAGLTQADVAARMATQPSVVARLEAGGGRQKHSPSLATLQRYAAAVGCRIEVKLVRVQPALSGAVVNHRAAARLAEPAPTYSHDKKWDESE